MIKPSEWIENTEKVINGFRVLKITKGEFAGIEYCYSKVEIVEEPDKDQARLSFEIDVISGSVASKKSDEFHRLTGDLLMAIIEEQLSKSEVVYSGGTS